MSTKSEKKPIVLSVEQALAMPYATLRFVHLGFRVIRLEQTPVGDRASRGDPNRRIGRPVAGDDRHSYFVAPNVGKEAIAVNLKDAAGREVLARLIRELGVDIFCTNTMPGRHGSLGIDDASLRRVREDLIWCSISAMGIADPDVPGYDPMIQALCGYMDLTGEKDGPPLQCGPPITDLKAGDEAFTQVILALYERAITGRGKMIDISMAHAAASWLQTFLPMLELGSLPEEVRRNGNAHRQFFPVNAYPTKDGFVYLVVGSDAQWLRLVDQPMFSTLNVPKYATNEGRRKHADELHKAIADVTREHITNDVMAVLREATVPHSRITPIEEVGNLDFIANTSLSTQTPDGRSVRLPPPAAATDHLQAIGGKLPFAPCYGEHTDAVLAEAGFGVTETANLRERGVIV